jgi:hypothetical protein
MFPWRHPNTLWQNMVNVPKSWKVLRGFPSAFSWVYHQPPAGIVFVVLSGIRYINALIAWI